MLLDIGLGILTAVSASILFDTELSWTLISLGIVFALVPDIDFLLEYIKHGSVGGKFLREHREITHYPITYIPATIIVYVIWGKVIAFMFIAGAILHLIHDSMGIGWGIKWLWPFNRNSYKLFAEKDNSLSKNFLVYWTSEELPRFVEKYGDPNWIKNIYFRPTIISIIETLGFLLSIILLYLFIR